jgi:hypothetical protein
MVFWTNIMTADRFIDGYGVFGEEKVWLTHVNDSNIE